MGGKKLEILFIHTTLDVLSHRSRTGFPPNLTDERYRKPGVRAMGKGSHQRFQFPKEVRRKSCSAVVRGKEMKFGLSETISSQLILCYNHTLSLHMNSITSERLRTHTHLSAVWVKYVYTVTPRSNWMGKANKRPVSHPDDITMWRKIKLRVIFW